MIEEIWKDIFDYDGLYQVSNLGRVKSFHKNKEMILKSFKNRCGYHQVDLFKNKKGKTITNHSLVMQMFRLEEKFNYTEINHIDGNKENNSVYNLEWCTRSYNIKHAYENGLKSSKDENNSNAKINKKIASIIRIAYKNKYFTQKELSELFDINTRSISNVILYKTWTSATV